MSAIQHHKYVGSLPGVLLANAIYYVRAGAGFDLYVTNDLGTVVAYPINGVAGTLSLTEKTLDFGTVPVKTKKFSWAHAGAVIGQKVLIAPSANMPGTRLPDELEMDNFAIAAYVSATDTITAFASAIPGPVSGEYNFNYTIS